MPSDKLRRISALEAEAAPTRIIVIIGYDPEPAPEPGVRIVRIKTGVPRSKDWTIDAPA